MFNYAHIENNKVIGIYSFDTEVQSDEYVLIDDTRPNLHDTYDHTTGLFAKEQAAVLEKPQIQVVSLGQIAISDEANTGLVEKGLGDITWLPINLPFSMKTTAEGLPDGRLMLMVERVVDGSKAVDDIRLLADIKEGQVTMKGVFKVSGNYLLRASRVNEGLERIGAPFRLDFKTVEFDAYEQVELEKG
ncbi:hypothetical protein [Pseudoalteromonas xiamenensis]|uniref:Uncharacterized protein n=1 Tax=Pseudoalteromonas xiamenensis TaxID=882626 RepID=A0A975DFT7_9GAMM|nr:hypothetical protein [Pseudoalteromonas xiamenensis]QTH70937.1 hypothetical protein J5O05_13795 [Pseudoalteromonas xiamenensis]